MKDRIRVLNRLAGLRALQVRQVMGRVTYQQNLCRRYRNNIAALTRLCDVNSVTSTPLQRHNVQQYKATLHAMNNLQVRELKLAEQTLDRIQQELLAVMRQEKVLVQVIEKKCVFGRHRWPFKSRRYRTVLPVRAGGGTR